MHGFYAKSLRSRPSLFLCKRTLDASLKVTCVIFLSIMTGCAHKMVVTPAANFIQHEVKLATINEGQLLGKLGIKATNDSGSANIRWEQMGQDYQINLSGPLGQQSMQISGKPGIVRLEQSGQPPLQAKSAELLVRQTTGWTLPVSQLIYWVRGLPAPKTPITQLQENESGLIGTLMQSGWVITYTNYNNQEHPGEEAIPLPQKIVAEREDIRLTFVIREWRLGSITLKSVNLKPVN